MKTVIIWIEMLTIEPRVSQISRDNSELTMFWGWVTTFTRILKISITYR